MPPTETRWPMDPHTAGKHIVLAEYLKAWFAIIGQSEGRMVFIDGFAGPGRYAGGEPGSPILAINILRDHQALSRFRAEAHFFFIENRPDRAAALRTELDSNGDLPGCVQHEVVEGTFATTLGDLLDQFAYSGAIRPPIPVESGHLFRTNPATQSGPIRPPGSAPGGHREGASVI